MARRPFFAQFPHINQDRAKALYNSDVYAPIKAMLELRRQLTNPTQRRLLDDFWQIAMKAAQAEVFAAGYTLTELIAVMSVEQGNVAPPQ